MGLLDLFRRKPPIRDVAALAEFIDGNAAFVAQKGIYEYSRARAGHYAKVLFREPEFQAAAENSRWSAYPLGLAMVSELVEGVLRPYADDRRAVLDRLNAISLSVFDRYPAPAVLGAERWSRLREELAHNLDVIGIHAVKPAKDIPIPFAERYFQLMPIHEKLRASEFPTIRNYLRVTMCNIHDEFSTRIDAPTLAHAVRTIPI
ncbi:MAG TPA: hypothetical protein VFB29_03030 [Pseudolabrys sp.]|nr:hypothetical protein [Pseudolabrys sp.]